MFGLLVDTFGAIELDRVHRFDNDWERDASLRLRRGDVTVAEIYEAHGRLHGGTLDQMERASVARWWERRQAGNKVLLMSPTNEATERLNQRCQRTRIEPARSTPTAGTSPSAPTTFTSATRSPPARTTDDLVTDRGEMVRNRAIWTVDHIHPDGSLTATGNERHRPTPRRLRGRARRAGLRPHRHRRPRPQRPRRRQLPRRAHRRPQPLRRDDPRHRHERSVHRSPPANRPRSTSSPNPSPPTGSTYPPTPAEPNSTTHPGTTNITRGSSSNGISIRPTRWTSAKPTSESERPTRAGGRSRSRTGSGRGWARRHAAVVA